MDDIRKVQYALYNLGYLKQEYITGEFDLNTGSALKKFQLNEGIIPNGQLNEATLDTLFNRITLTVNTIELNEVEENGEVYISAPNNNAFFGGDKLFRKNNVPIRIEYGPNKTSRKVLSNVHFRSVGQEIDGSGNPIYEVIEFIASDIKEE